MEDETEQNNDVIKKAFIALRENVETSSLPNNEKEALRVLIDKISIYYDRKLETLSKRGIASREKIMILKGFITDIIVEINSVLRGENDIYYFVSIINKRLNDKEIDRVVKRKKK